MEFNKQQSRVHHTPYLNTPSTQREFALAKKVRERPSTVSTLPMKEPDDTAQYGRAQNTAAQNRE